MSIGLRVLASLIDSSDGVRQYTQLALDDELFVGTLEVELAQLVRQHIQQYGKLPSRQTVNEVLGGVPLPTEIPEPPVYYADRLKERHVFHQLKVAMLDAERLMNDGQSRAALETLLKNVSLTQLFIYRNRVLDFTTEGDALIRREYIRKKKEGDEYGLNLGWPTFDAMSGGLSGGDLLVFVGRPGAGKTYLMLYTALEAWKCGQVPMFVSMEMKPLLIAQRLAAMATRKSITQLRHADMSNWAVADMHEQLQLLAQRKQPFWLIDGALSATVDDLLLMVRQLQPSVLYVDGAYLIRTAGWRNSKWERLAEIIERLKSEVAEQMNIPVLVSYQFNRGATKKSTEILGVEDIGGTDVIGQLASVVLGLLQEQGVETLRQRRVQILKGRSGESGLFNICWNFDTGPDYMNFREITTAQAGEDLDYIV